MDGQASGDESKSKLSVSVYSNLYFRLLTPHDPTAKFVNQFATRRVGWRATLAAIIRMIAHTDRLPLLQCACSLGWQGHGRRLSCLVYFLQLQALGLGVWPTIGLWVGFRADVDALLALYVCDFSETASLPVPSPGSPSPPLFGFSFCRTNKHMSGI